MIEKISLGYSPLSNMIYLFRHGKDPNLALEKREAMKDVLAVIVEYLMDESPKGSTINFTLGDNDYKLTLKPTLKEDK